MRKVEFGDLTAGLEFFVECPECDRELVVTNVFAHVKCPYCGTTFKPHTIKARARTHRNPSFRGFSVGEEVHGQERT